MSQLVIPATTATPFVQSIIRQDHAGPRPLSQAERQERRGRHETGVHDEELQEDRVREALGDRGRDEPLQRRREPPEVRELEGERRRPEQRDDRCRDGGVAEMTRQRSAGRPATLRREPRLGPDRIHHLQGRERPHEPRNPGRRGIAARAAAEHQDRRDREDHDREVVPREEER